MSYLSDKILESLKEARQQKGLSQRELSARSGVPQSHISKIESGAVDIRVSSLIALARVLDLELELVPRKSIPAVRSIVRSGNRSEMSNIQHRLKSQIDAYRDVFKTLPQLDKPSVENLKKIQSAVNAIEQYKPSPEVLKVIESSREVIERVLKNSRVYPLQNTMDEMPSHRLKEVQKALAKAARQLSNVRNKLTLQGIESRYELSGPAYSLEDDDA